MSPILDILGIDAGAAVLGNLLSVWFFGRLSDDFETRKQAEIAEEKFYEVLYAASKTVQELHRLTGSRISTLTEKQVVFAETLLARLAKYEAAHEARVQAARYAGDEGDKVTVTGTVVVETSYDRQVTPWSTSYTKMIVVEGTGEYAGITAKWSGTAEAIWAIAKGDTVTLTGTVKKQDECKGVAQTVLTRCKVA